MGRGSNSAAEARASSGEGAGTDSSAAAAGPGLVWGLRVGLVALTLVAFWPALSQGLVDWDDSLNLLENERFRGFSAENLRWMFFETHVGHWQPLTWLSFALDWELWGDDWRRYHLLSLALHAANALLFFALARVLFARAAGTPGQGSLSDAGNRAQTWGAGLAAALFAVHPLRVESVAWATERRDVLAGFFLLLTMLFWLRAVAQARLRVSALALALVCFALSLFSKAWGITLPVVLLVLDAWPLRRWRATGGEHSTRTLLIEKLPWALFACLAAYVALRAQAVGQGGQTAVMSLADHPLANRLAQASYGLVFYVQKTLWPVGLSPLYELEVEFDALRTRYVVAGTLVVVITLAAWFARRRYPAVLVAWLTFVVIVSPVSGLAQSGAQIAADRYTYLACMPFALLGGAALGALCARSLSAGLGLGALLVGGATLLSVQQTRVWRDSPTLWEHAVAVEPDSYVAHYNLAVNFHRAGQLDQAQAAFRRSVECHPGEGNYQARLELVKLLRRSGELAEAEAELRRGLAEAPQTWDLLTYLGQMIGAARAPELEPLWAAGVAADPEDWRGLYVHAEYLLSIDKPDEATQQWRRSAELAANTGEAESPEPFARLAEMLVQRADWQGAELAWRNACILSQRLHGRPNPAFTLGHARALLALGKTIEAQNILNKYLPGDPRAQALLQQAAGRRP